jgi:hypothetical protein
MGKGRENEMKKEDRKNAKGRKQRKKNEGKRKETDPY